MGKPGFPIPLRGGGVGKPGFPTPLSESLCSRETVMRMAPNAVMNIRLFLGGLRPPKPSQGRGLGARASGPHPLRYGVTRLPHTPPPRDYVHVSRPCDSRTTPDEHGLGARASCPHRGSAGTVTAPLPSPPPAGGRESGSSPQRGEVRRGGSAACA